MERRAQQTQLPKGAKLYPPDEAAAKRAVEERLVGVFRRWGYRDIVTPAYEYFDVLALGTDHDLQERMFKMVDRESGRLLALRAAAEEIRHELITASPRTAATSDRISASWS